MDRPSKSDMEHAKVALFDYDDAPALETVDRSTLEHALTCPFQARAIADGRCKSVGILAEAGQAVHDAFAEVLHSYIDSRGAMSPTDLRLDLENSIVNSRPDVQPEAIRAMQGAAWEWTRLINGIHPENILAFDGGEDIGKSGQLAYDFPDLGVRYTSEVDLLYQGDCPEVGEEVDYKTGWKDWSSEDIRDSFQFQSHAVLALEKYPQWQALRVRVFDARHRRLTYCVHFPRERLFQWKVRIRSAIGAWRLSQQSEPPCWPATEKCGVCPAACLCPVADEAFVELHEPATFLAKMAAVDACLTAMQKLAASWVDTFGRDMESGTLRFGRQKPRSERKPAASLYSVKENRNGSD